MASSRGGVTHGSSSPTPTDYYGGSIRSNAATLGGKSNVNVNLNSRLLGSQLRNGLLTASNSGDIPSAPVPPPRPLVASTYVNTSRGGKVPELPTTPRLQYEGGRHLIPEHLPTPRRGENAVALKLMELNDENLNQLMKMAKQLLRLDLGGVHLSSFPFELVINLTGLRQLLLDNNELANDSFPKQFAASMNVRLLELSMRQNRLQGRIPDSILYLTNLQRLNLEGNDIVQLRGIENLTKLRQLILDNNNIANLPVELYNLKFLEVFYLTNNKLTAFSGQIKNMTALREINMAGNMLKTVPGAVFLLPRLEGINLSRNQITNIPTLLFKGQPGKHLVEDIDLSENKLTVFPHSLPLICRHLDLSHNEIRVIPDQVLKRLRWHESKSIQLQGNPMKYPSMEVCENGFSAIVQNYHETRQNTPTFQGVKLLFMGASGCGKTSLIQTMMDSQTRLVEGVEDRTKCFDIYTPSWEFEQKTDPDDTVEDEEPEHTQPGDEVPKPVATSKVDMCLVDFSGDPFYDFVYSYVDQLPCFLVLCVDLSTYAPEKFEEKVGHFLDLCIAHNNRVVCFIVGTKSDLQSATFSEQDYPNFETEAPRQLTTTEKLLKLIHFQVTEYLQHRIDRMRSEIDKIESQSSITMAMSEQLKLFIKLSSLRVMLYHEAVACNARQVSTVTRLQTTLCHFVTENESFDQVLRLIPPLWRDVEDFVEEASIEQPLINLQRYVDRVHKKFGLRQVAKKITQYLHDTGRVLWREQDSRLRETIVAAPSVVLLCIKRLFHANVNIYLDGDRDEDEVRARFLKDNFSNITKWQHGVHRLHEWGILTPSLAKALWSDVLSDLQTCEMLAYICCDLQLGFPISPSANPPANQAPPYVWSPLSFPEEELEKTKKGKSSKKTKKRASRSGRSKASARSQRSRLDSGGPSEESSQEMDDAASSDEDANERRDREDKDDEDEDAENAPKTRDRQLFDDGAIPLIFFPSLCRLSSCGIPSLNQMWNKASQSPEQHGLVVGTFAFDDTVTADLFQRIVVRLHDYETTKLRYESVWRDGVCFSSSVEEHVSGRILCKTNTGVGVLCISLEMLHEDFAKDNFEEEPEKLSPAEEEELQHVRMTSVWNCLLMALLNVNQLLEEWEGLCYRRFMNCPKCAMPSFLGEWLSPKEVQASSHLLCRLCGEEVSTVFIAPPKERRKIDATKKLKEEMRARKEQQAAEVRAKIEANKTLAAASQANRNQLQSAHQRANRKTLPKSASKGSTSPTNATLLNASVAPDGKPLPSITLYTEHGNTE